MTGTGENSRSLTAATDWPAPWRGDPNTRPGHRSVRFEEGIGWDTDVPREFLLGMRQGEGDPGAAGGARYTHIRPGSPPRPNQNVNVFDKPREETMRERGHVGSASWVEAPYHLQAFADGAADEKRRIGAVDGDEPYAHELRDGSHYSRPSHARIED